MSTLRRRIVIIIVSLAMAIDLAPIGRAVAATAAASSSLTIVGAPGSTLLGQGLQATDDTAASVQSTGTSVTWISNGTANAPSLGLAGLANAGTYAVVTTTPAAGQVSLKLGTTGATCSATGKLTVLQIRRDSTTGNIDSFAAVFAASCGGVTPNVGDIRWNVGSTARYGVLAAGTSTTKTLTFTNPVGSSPVTYGHVSIVAPSGKKSTAFTITSDSCSGATVAAAASCSIGVRGWAEDVGGETAGLELPATSSASDSQLVTLALAGKEAPNGGYVPVSPARVLDTRSGNGAPKAAVGAGKTVTVQITGRGGVASSGVSAVVLNLTVTGPTASSYLTAYPAGSARPTASSINFVRGDTRANLVTVPLSSSGKVSIYNGSGSTQIIGDVDGYYLSSASTATKYGSYQPSTAVRIFDSRTDGGPLPAGQYVTLGVDYGQTWATHIKALAVNITSVGQSGPGYLTAYQQSLGGAAPATSSVNFSKGATTANMAVVPVTSVYDPSLGYAVSEFNIKAFVSSTNVVVDVVGFYDDHSTYSGGRFASLASPKRIVDSRIRLGTTPLGPNSTHVITPPASVAGWNTWALVCNATLVTPTASTYVKLWGVGRSAPTTSNVNASAKQVIANMAMPIAGQNDAFNAYNLAGTTNLVIDVAGTMEGYPQLPNGVATPDAAPMRGAALRPLMSGAVARGVGSTN